MRSKFKWIFTLLLAFSMQFSFAQQKTVTGVITEGGLPLPGVSVLVKGTSRGTQTDVDGRYSISANQGEVLVFSSIGMKTKSVSVGASSTVSLALEPDAEDLGEVVVEGYKKTTRAKSNNAVVTVSAGKIEGRPNANFIQTLQGQVAGLNITTGSGQPGSNSTVILRGAGSINGNIEPLYIIDGVPLNVDNFRTINPNDIESVSVLKDAGATSIYGNRGANGVIVVTTKKGSFDSALEIKYQSTYGITELQKNKYNTMGSADLLRTERAYGVGRGFGKTDDQINALANVNTNWKDVFFRTGVSQNHVLNLTSGSKNLSSFTSIAYLGQQGILNTTDLNRFNFRNNLNGRSDNKKFTYSTNVTVNYSRRNEATNVGTGGVNQNYVLGANNSLPYISPNEYVNSAQLLDLYNTSGSLALTPLFLLDKLSNDNFIARTEELKLILSGTLGYELAEGLNLGTRIGVDYTQNNSLTSQSPTSFNSLLFQVDNEFLGFQSEGFTRDVQISAVTSLKYTKTFNEKHTLDLGAYTEYNKGHYKSFNYRQDGLDPITYSPGNGSGFVGFNPQTPEFYVPTVGASKIESGMFSYFGTADYDYDSTYGIGATIRRDGSFRFTGDNQWATFWSVSGRWNINNESFMENSVFDMLKLRGSYGTTGNQLIVGQNGFNGVSLPYNLSNFGNSYNNANAYAFVQIGNPNLKWETVKQANIGLDFEVFQSRLSGSIDVYEKKTEDLYQGVPLSAITGFTEINDNFGSLRNRGVELSVRYDVVRNATDGFKFSVYGNGSYNKNELMKLPNENGLVWDGGLTANREGDVLNQYYLVKYAGVNPANGNLLFYDKNGALTENPNDNDRVFTGKSALPVYQGAFGFDTSYKGFFIATQFTFVADIDRYDYDLSGLQDPSNLGQFNVSTDLLRAWTPTNRVTDIPSLNATNLALDSFSDRNLKDASYIRLRSLTVGYDFPQRFLDQTFIKHLRIFSQAENYVTWSKWRGWDAESTRAADQYQYPTPKILSFGLEVQF